MDARALADELDARLRAAGTPDRAEQEKRYLKSDLTFYGVTVPAVRAALTQALAGLDDLEHDDLVAVVEALWARPVHECRAAAVDLLELRAGLLTAGDLGLLERLIRESRTWALVDNLAASVAGPLVERFPSLTETLDRWAVDGDFWVRRSALLAHLLPLRGGGGDFERFGAYADRMLEEQEFFIRKAIGWVLRDTARKRPELVVAWLRPRLHRLSGVTVREAVKPLPAATRDELMTAWRDRAVR